MNCIECYIICIPREYLWGTEEGSCFIMLCYVVLCLWRTVCDVGGIMCVLCVLSCWLLFIALLNLCMCVCYLFVVFRRVLCKPAPQEFWTCLRLVQHKASEVHIYIYIYIYTYIHIQTHVYKRGKTPVSFRQGELRLTNKIHNYFIFVLCARSAKAFQGRASTCVSKLIYFWSEAA